MRTFQDFASVSEDVSRSTDFIQVRCTTQQRTTQMVGKLSCLQILCIHENLYTTWYRQLAGWREEKHVKNQLGKVRFWTQCGGASGTTTGTWWDKKCDTCWGKAYNVCGDVRECVRRSGAACLSSMENWKPVGRFVRLHKHYFWGKLKSGWLFYKMKWGWNQVLRAAKFVKIFVL